MIASNKDLARPMARLAGVLALSAASFFSQSDARADGYRHRANFGFGAPVGHGQRTVPAALPLGAGVVVQSPYSRLGNGSYVRVPHYQGPDGAYDSLVELSREVNGVPCGIDCQRRALVRWGYAPAF